MPALQERLPAPRSERLLADLQQSVRQTRRVHVHIKTCNPKVLGESPTMVNSQKWSGEGAKGLLSPGSEDGVAPMQNGVASAQNGSRMVQKTLGRLLLPVAPSVNHFWEFTVFGLCPRTFGLQIKTFYTRPHGSQGLII